MQMAQFLAKVQFPVTGGLESILLQGKRKGHSTVNSPMYSEQCANNILQQETSLDNSVNKAY